MKKSVYLWVPFVTLFAMTSGGCLEDPAKYPNDSPSRVLNEMKRPAGTPILPAAVADDRDARIAALEAQLAAERNKPPKVVERVVEKTVEVPVPVERVVEKIVKVPVIELHADALFDSGKAELRPNAAKALENSGDALKKVRGTIKAVRVDGHADNRRISTKEFPNNQVLSEARARTVARFLANHSGLPEQKFIVTGHGDAMPIASNDTAEGQSRNRRVEVSIDQGEQ